MCKFENIGKENAIKIKKYENQLKENGTLEEEKMIIRAWN